MPISDEEVDRINEYLSDPTHSKVKPVTSEELASLREMLRAWETWKAMGRVGKILIWALAGLAAIISASETIRNAVYRLVGWS